MMEKIAGILDELAQVEHGFTHIIEAGNSLLHTADCQFAAELLNDSRYQARMLGTYLLGKLSATEPNAFHKLRHVVAKDENWRVQEMLAKAFDEYARTKGYRESMPEVKEWLGDGNPNVVRAVIEGLRIWTSRPYFKENPEIAVECISRHKADASEYVRKSVGNALRDIRRKHRDLIDKELSTWDLSDQKIAFTSKLVLKRG